VHIANVGENQNMQVKLVFHFLDSFTVTNLERQGGL